MGTGRAGDPRQGASRWPAIRAPTSGSRSRSRRGSSTGSTRSPSCSTCWLTSGDDPLIPQIVWQNLHPLLEDRARSSSSRRLERCDGTRPPASAPLLPAADRAAPGQPDDADAASAIAVSWQRSQDEVDCARCLDVLAEPIPRDRADGRGSRSRCGASSSRSCTAHGSEPARGRPCRRRILLAVLRRSGPASERSSHASPRSGQHRSRMRLRAFEAVCVPRSRPGSIRPLVGEILDRTHGARVADFRGKVLDALGELDDPELGDRRARGVSRSCRRRSKPRADRAPDRAPRLEQGPARAVADKRDPGRGAERQPAPQAPAEQGPEIAGRVKAIWGTIREGRNPQREQVVGQMRGLLRRTPGDPVAGQAVFKKLCAQCHKIHGEGQDVGPDITLERPQRLRPARSPTSSTRAWSSARATRRRPSPPPTAAS